jgi:glutathione S-transferase
VPALVTERGTLFQSSAILLHLAETHRREALLPSDPTRRAAALSWLGFVTSDVHPSFRPLFQPDAYAGEAARAELRERSAAKLARQLAVLDAALDGRSFLGGDEPSLADPYLLVFSMWCRNLELPVPPRVAETAGRVAARPGFARALAIETPLYTG